MEELIRIIILGAATALASATISNSRMFKTIRYRLVYNQMGYQKDNFFANVIQCHYCLDHWVAALLVFLEFGISPPIDMLVAWLSVTCVAVLLSSLILFAVWNK